MLDELQEIAGDETARIIALFLEDAPRLIAQLEGASALPDLDAMRDAAHTLKSSSANVGAMALSTSAKRVELGARAMKLDRPAVAVALVIAEYARARMALQGYVSQLNRNARVPVAPADQSSSLVSR
jgi:HPt (histidine-containing phosphotransfer) domain-containing protein